METNYFVYPPESIPHQLHLLPSPCSSTMGEKIISIHFLNSAHNFTNVYLVPSLLSFFWFENPEALWPFFMGKELTPELPFFFVPNHPISSRSSPPRQPVEFQNASLWSCLVCFFVFPWTLNGMCAQLACPTEECGEVLVVWKGPPLQKTSVPSKDSVDRGLVFTAAVVEEV